MTTLIKEEEEKKRLVISEHTAEGEEEEGCNCSCKKMWKGYKGCIEFTFFGIYSGFRCFFNSIYLCCGFFFFPIKERFCNCCDNVDKDLNPYKDPNYNPYDYL